MILHLYFARRFLALFAGILAAFVVFGWLVALVENVRRFDSAAAGFGRLAYISALSVPEGVYEILPLVVLLAALALFLGLARRSEMVIVRASGRSALRALLAPALAGALAGAAVVAVGNPLVATFSQLHESAENRLRGSERVVSVSREGLWLRQGTPERQTAIHAESANMDGTRLYGVSFYAFDRRDQALYRIDAGEARLGAGAWVLRDAKRWEFAAGGVPEAEAVRRPVLFVPTDLTRDQIRDSFGTPSAIPVWDLPGFIDRLERAGFSARSHRVWLQSELAKPVTFLAMVLIGAAFTLRHQRGGRTGLTVLLAVLAGFGFHLVASLARIMGESGQVPVALAIWSPPAAAICLVLALLLHLEDG